MMADRGASSANVNTINFQVSTEFNCKQCIIWQTQNFRFTLIPWKFRAPNWLADFLLCLLDLYIYTTNNKWISKCKTVELGDQLPTGHHVIMPLLMAMFVCGGYVLHTQNSSPCSPFCEMVLEGIVATAAVWSELNQHRIFRGWENNSIA